MHALRGYVSRAMSRASAPQRVGTGNGAPDYPWGAPPEESPREIEETVRTWGTYASAEEMVRYVAPTHADDPDFVAA